MGYYTTRTAGGMGAQEDGTGSMCLDRENGRLGSLLLYSSFCAAARGATVATGPELNQNPIRITPPRARTSRNPVGTGVGHVFLFVKVCARVYVWWGVREKNNTSTPNQKRCRRHRYSQPACSLG